MHKVLLCLFCVCVGPGRLPAQTTANTAFAKLQALNGDWEGTYAWSGGRNNTGKMFAHYYATGNESAMVEDLAVDGVPVMTTVYHMDGSDLRLTHFCAAQNQPRLKETAIDPDGKRILFSFVDITNLRSPTAGHVHGLEVRFLEADHITLRFQFKSGDKDSDELIDLHRKK